MFVLYKVLVVAVVIMEPELLDLLKHLHKNRRMDCLLVFNDKGKIIGDFRKSWESACTAIGKSGLLFHDLRRSGVRNMVRAGIPERVAMTISGHKTCSVFDRYNIVSEDDLKEAAVRRQNFTAKQVEWLQNGYNLPKNGKTVLTLNSATP